MLFAALFFGLIIGALVGYFYQKSKASAVFTEKQILLVEKAALQFKLSELETDNKLLVEKNSGMEVLKTTLDVQKANLEEKIKEQAEFFDKAQQMMKEQFENISNKQLQESAGKILEASSLKISDVIKPLYENIEKFKKEFSETYGKEEKERFALTKEIQRIVEVSNNMRSTTDNLTKALKGDNKQQGNWGEFILERILEEAGLRKDFHYTAQTSFVDEEGKRQQPDVIIMLPENKHIIVDSKVSLISYERYFTEEADEAKILHAKTFIDSIKTHIKGLSSKSYHSNQDIITPDFVIMFMPIEGTFQLATQYDRDIFSYAWANNVVLTSPSTLFPMLKTVGSIWKIEAQNKNTQEIIKTATLLYDKFMSVAESIENIGDYIHKSEKAYDEAVSRLRDGRGSAVSIVRRLEGYGVVGNKKPPKIAQVSTEVEDAPEDARIEESA